MNGICDEECSGPECGFDGYDCHEHPPNVTATDAVGMLVEAPSDAFINLNPMLAYLAQVRHIVYILKSTFLILCFGDAFTFVEILFQTCEF